MMKNILLLLMLISMLSCHFQGTGFRVKIETKNYDADTIKIGWFAPDGDCKVEYIIITNGKGEIAFTDISKDTRMTLVNLDPRNQIKIERGFIPGPSFMFYAEENPIKISLDGDKWPEITITGGTLNSDVSRYWKEIVPLEAQCFDISREIYSGNVSKENLYKKRSALRREQERIKQKFIDQNPNSVLSLDLITEQFSRMKIEDVERLFNNLAEELRSSEKGLALAKLIAIDKSMAPGNAAPLFTKKDKDENTISLADYRGKYVLLDFWGTWCGPCRASHPHLVELYEKYSPLGLEFINIAQEGSVDNRDSWLKAIEEDGLVWTQILNDEGKEQCDVVKLYGIKFFPTKILIDPNGVLTSVASKDLDEKLKEIFGE